MLTLNGIRNGIWCMVAFGIVACAATPMPRDKVDAQLLSAPLENVRASAPKGTP